MCLMVTCDWHLWYNNLSELEKEEIAENCTRDPRPDLKCSLSCYYCQLNQRPSTAEVSRYGEWVRRDQTLNSDVMRYKGKLYYFPNDEVADYPPS